MKNKKILIPIIIIIVVIFIAIFFSSKPKKNNTINNKDLMLLSNKKIASIVCEKLEEKYHKKFEADKVINYSSGGYVKVMLHPLDNKNILFDAEIRSETFEVRDTYLGHKMAYKWNKELEKMGKDAGLEIKVKATAGEYGDKNEEIKDYTPEEFFKEHRYSDAHVIVAVKTDYEGLIQKQVEKFEEMAQQLERELDYPCGLKVYFYAEDGYKKACEFMEKYSSVSSADMNDADPYKCILILSKDGVISKKDL